MIRNSVIITLGSALYVSHVISFMSKLVGWRKTGIISSTYIGKICTQRGTFKEEKRKRKRRQERG